MPRETRKLNLLALLLALSLVPGAAQAGREGEFDDPFGDLSRTQQKIPLDDEAFAGVVSQDLSDFHDVSQHGKPVRQRARTFPGSYRFYDTDFDVFWDTVAFRSRESQGEGAALITLMFKDVCWFDPARRRSNFSVDTFVGLALRNCGGSSRPQPRPRPLGQKSGVDGGFVDVGVGATLDRKANDNFDFDLGVSVGNDQRGFEDPFLSTGEPLLFRSDRYVVGSYQGLYDFSRERTDLVKNFLVRAAQDSHYEKLYQNAFFAPDETTAYAQIKRLLVTRRLPVLALMPKQRDAVLIYRVVERGDGLGAMMYWRPSDPVNQRVRRELGRENLIWAVPQPGRGIMFVDRADLQNRRFKFGNHATMLIVPNLCRVYSRFASTLGGGSDGPDYRPGPGPRPFPDYDQGYPRPDQGYPLPDYDQGRRVPPYVPDCFPDQQPRRKGGGLDWMVDLVFGGGRNGINIGIGGGSGPGYQRPPPFQLDPPRWEPMPPPIYDGPYPPPTYRPPPPSQFRFRPPVKNPYCNKPVGQGRGKFVYIGFGFDERGYNEWGFDTAGLNMQGFDPWGYDKNGYGQDGFDPWGYDRGGYDRRGFPIFNRAREFQDLVAQYHRDPFAFRMQFDISETGTITRIIDGNVVWNQGGAPLPGPGVPVPGTVTPPPVVAPPIPGPQKATEPEFRTVTITGKIKGITAPYEVQIDRSNRYFILKDGKQTAVPRNINVNADFEMQFQDKSKDWIFIQSTPATK